MRRDFWAGRTKVCEYVYHDQNGAVVFSKNRFRLDEEIHGRTKDFRYQLSTSRCRSLNAGGRCPWQTRWEINNAGPWRGGTHPHKPADAHRWIYRLPEVLEAIEQGRDIHWAEGEKDADALWDAGVAATSVHQGACKCEPAQAKWLLGARRVIIWVDKDWYGDDPHPEVGAFDAALRYNTLVRAGYFATRVSFVRARGVGRKDAADHLERYSVEQAVLVNQKALGLVARKFHPSMARYKGYA